MGSFLLLVQGLSRGAERVIEQLTHLAQDQSVGLLVLVRPTGGSVHDVEGISTWFVMREWDEHWCMMDGHMCTGKGVC